MAMRTSLFSLREAPVSRADRRLVMYMAPAAMTMIRPTVNPTINSIKETPCWRWAPR